jgi:hypothetical protein
MASTNDDDADDDDGGNGNLCLVVEWIPRTWSFATRGDSSCYVHDGGTARVFIMTIDTIAVWWSFHVMQGASRSDEVARDNL